MAHLSQALVKLGFSLDSPAFFTVCEVICLCHSLHCFKEWIFSCSSCFYYLIGHSDAIYWDSWLGWAGEQYQAEKNNFCFLKFFLVDVVQNGTNMVWDLPKLTKGYIIKPKTHFTFNITDSLSCTQSCMACALQTNQIKSRAI